MCGSVSSKLENGEASYYLGLIYIENTIVNSNYKKAYNYFKLSIKQESFSGYYGLAICYLEGINVKPNIKKAIKNLNIALDNGIKDIYNLKDKLEGLNILNKY